MSDLTKHSELKNCTETPMSDRVDRFWRLLETEHVRIRVDLMREIGHDSPDGPTVYWDCSTFSDYVAKALIKDRNTRPASAGVREVLRNLVSKLHKVHQHPQYKAVWTLHQIYNGQYTGPNYEEEFKAANLALSDHGVQKSAGSWRPIESAPRDGTGILVKLPDSDMPHTAKFWRGSWTVAWDHSELKGWDAPTHWMPLPELPSDALLSKTLTEGEKKRPQIETPPANEGSSLSPDGGASS